MLVLDTKIIKIPLIGRSSLRPVIGQSAERFLQPFFETCRKTIFLKTILQGLLSTDKPRIVICKKKERRFFETIEKKGQGVDPPFPKPTEAVEMPIGVAETGDESLFIFRSKHIWRF